jgi:hypothetical protein
LSWHTRAESGGDRRIKAPKISAGRALLGRLAALNSVTTIPALPGDFPVPLEDGPCLDLLGEYPVPALVRPLDTCDGAEYGSNLGESLPVSDCDDLAVSCGVLFMFARCLDPFNNRIVDEKLPCSR